MDDRELIELFWERKETALTEIASKYGKLCFSIACGILKNHEDAEECVNDAYLAVWNAIPPQRPQFFPIFLGRITRNLSLKKYEHLSAAKRNPSATVSLTELGNCVSGKASVESELENRQIEEAISRFLWMQRRCGRSCIHPKSAGDDRTGTN